MIKKVAVIVAVLVITSLCIAGCTTMTTPSKSSGAVGATVNKRLQYPVFGRVSCEPEWTYGIKFLPTDGSGSTSFYDCNGNVDKISNRHEQSTTIHERKRMGYDTLLQQLICYTAIRKN